MRRSAGGKIPLGADRWSRLRAGQQITSALKGNSLVCVSISNQAIGPPEQQVCVFGRTFYVDSAILQLLENLNTVILPCFVLCNDRGRVQLILHPPLAGTIDATSQTYCKVFSDYLTRFPEFCRFWKPLVQNRPRWQVIFFCRNNEIFSCESSRPGKSASEDEPVIFALRQSNYFITFAIRSKTLPLNCRLSSRRIFFCTLELGVLGSSLRAPVRSASCPQSG